MTQDLSIMDGVATTDTEETVEQKRNYLLPFMAAFGMGTVAAVAAVGTVGLTLAPAIVVAAVGMGSGLYANKIANKNIAKPKGLFKKMVASIVGTGMALTFSSIALDKTTDCEFQSTAPVAAAAENPVIIATPPPAPVTIDKATIDKLTCANDEITYYRACENAPIGVDGQVAQAHKDMAIKLLRSGQHEAGLEILNEAAAKGNVSALVDLAWIEYHGKYGVEKNEQAAMDKMKDLVDCDKRANELYQRWNGTWIEVVQTPVAPAPVTVQQQPTVYTMPTTTPLPDCGEDGRNNPDFGAGLCGVTTTYGSGSYTAPAPASSSTVYVTPAAAEPATCSTSGSTLSHCQISDLQFNRVAVVPSVNIDGQFIPITSLTQSGGTTYSGQFERTCDDSNTFVAENGVTYSDCGAISFGDSQNQNTQIVDGRKYNTSNLRPKY